MRRSSWLLSLGWLACGLSPTAEGATMPSFAEVRAAYASSEGRLLDRRGELLQERRLDFRGRHLGWIPLTEVSPSLLEAVREVEDKRFFEHRGVDYRAVAAALWQNVRGRRRGASTITMQTVNFLDQELGAHRGARRGWWHKLRQGQLAWELEGAWTKEQILEAYLNMVGFRGEFRGLLAASRALFGKDPHGLDLRESYLLAALLRSPGAAPAAVGERLCGFRHPGLADCASLRAFAATVLGGRREIPESAELAPHLARRLLTAGEPEQRTSLDAGLQRTLVRAIDDQMRTLRSQNVKDAAAIVVENRTGQVLAYVGSSGRWSESPQVDMIQSRRQAGSTLKPFLYGLAFERGLLKPGSWLLDEPFELPLERGAYRPENYDRSFHGPVTAGTALASSLNIPAVRVIDLLGVEEFRDQLERLGISGLESADFYGPSLALGSADVSLADLTAAYAALANGGTRVTPRFRAGGGGKGSLVMAPAAAAAVTAILADRDARAPTFGWDGTLSTRFPSAVKTGTSKDMRDNWCIGFTREFTVGVWVGNAGGLPMWQVSGVEGAAPIWRAAMDYLQARRPGAALPTLVAESPRFQVARFGRIAYPANGDVLALDPDIPADRQLVPLESDLPGSFEVDGRRLKERSWKPERGRHVVRLVSDTGRTLDEVRIEVR